MRKRLWIVLSIFITLGIIYGVDSNLSYYSAYYAQHQENPYDKGDVTYTMLKNMEVIRGLKADYLEFDKDGYNRVTHSELELSIGELPGETVLRSGYFVKYKGVAYIFNPSGQFVTARVRTTSGAPVAR